MFTIMNNAFLSNIVHQQYFILFRPKQKSLQIPLMYEHSKISGCFYMRMNIESLKFVRLRNESSQDIMSSKTIETIFSECRLWNVINPLNVFIFIIL